MGSYLLFVVVAVVYFQIVHRTCYIDKKYNHKIRTICLASTLA